MYQAVLFDMDGTILDTITDLTICTNYALSQLGKPHEFPAELVKLCYGCGIEADMQKALAMAAGCAGEDLEYVENPTPLSSYGLTAQDTARLQSIFVPYYSAHCHLHTTPYDGIPALLSHFGKEGSVPPSPQTKTKRMSRSSQRCISPVFSTPSWAIPLPSIESLRPTCLIAFFMTFPFRKNRLSISATQRWISKRQKTPALPASPSHGAFEIKASSPATERHASQKMQRSWPWNWE